MDKNTMEFIEEQFKTNDKLSKHLWKLEHKTSVLAVMLILVAIVVVINLGLFCMIAFR